MKKTFEKSGKDGTYKGSVEIELYAIPKAVKSHNPSTHEDSIKNVKWHSVKGYAHNKLICDFEVPHLEEIPEFVAMAEQNVDKKLTDLSLSVHKPTIQQLLSERGYN